MAVWLFAYGKNGLLKEGIDQPENYLNILNNITIDEVKILDSILEANRPNDYYLAKQDPALARKDQEDFLRSMTPDIYKAYLESLNIPHIDIEDVADYVISMGEKYQHEKRSNFQQAYDQFNKGKTKSIWEESHKGSFTNKLLYFDPYNGLRLSICNDLIWISGPFAVFSVYDTFLRTISTASRDYYHSLFKQIFTAFKSDFILYAHEWSGLDDEDDNEFDLVKLKEQSDWENTTSNSIHTMDRFYYERL